jgi:hypothetical protein
MNKKVINLFGPAINVRVRIIPQDCVYHTLTQTVSNSSEVVAYRGLATI